MLVASRAFGSPPHVLRLLCGLVSPCAQMGVGEPFTFTFTFTDGNGRAVEQLRGRHVRGPSDGRQHHLWAARAVRDGVDGRGRAAYHCRCAPSHHGHHASET